MGLRIPYESVDFPPNTVKNGKAELCVTWDDILWAAVTVGRPGWFYVFQHGISSGYEARFRWSLIKMALEQRSPRSRRLTRTDAARALDPTEKGMVSYFLGMTFCKLFSASLLDTPWAVHLDVLRPQLDTKLGGRSRPDLIGLEHNSTRWHGFECKGRSNQPDLEVKSGAKRQARRLESLDIPGFSRSLLVAAITYFRNDVLHFYWCDSPPERQEGMSVDVPDEAWRHYYGPVAEMMNPSRTQMLAEMRSPADDSPHWQASIGPCDLEVGVHRAIRRHLLSQEWTQARNVAIDAGDEFRDEGLQVDGLRIRAGESWYQRSQESLQSH